MTVQDFGPKGWTPAELESLKGKTYLITGASSGTGMEAARIFLSKGASVVMLNRNLEKSERVIAELKADVGNDADVQVFQMDLSELNSVRKAAEEVLQKIPKIDALICNAAIAQVSAQTLTVDGFESQLGVNHFGHFLLSGLLFERLNESHGRIVVVSSEGHKLGGRIIQFDDLNFDKKYNPNNAYSQSKLAQMMFAYELQRRVKSAGCNVKTYVCHPGASKTGLIDDKASGATRFIWYLMTLTPMVQSAEKGAYPEVMCATKEGLKQQAYYGPTGMMNFGGPVGECELEEFVLDEAVCGRLWSVSEEKTSYSWVM